MYPMFPQATLTCGCAWIDSKGAPTPDTNDAIAMAVCHDPASFGEKGSDPFPICLEHAERKTKYWKMYPLPGQAEADCHRLVKDDARYFRVIPDGVSESIKKSFPDQALEILSSLRWSYDHYSFQRWGMYVGVELDGYIHT